MKGLQDIGKIREYCDYVEEHLLNIEAAWMTLREACQHMRFVYDDYVYHSIDHMVRMHDLSKMSAEEFIPYQRKFFPAEEYKGGVWVRKPEHIAEEKAADKIAFDAAWQHHQDENPHHWQNWARAEYSNPYEAECHCVCMVIDWMAMGLKFGDTAQQYYEANKSKIEMPEWAVTFIGEMFAALNEHKANPDPLAPTAAMEEASKDDAVNTDGDTIDDIRAAWTGPGSVEMECKITGWQGLGRSDMIGGDVTGLRIANKHTEDQ